MPEAPLLATYDRYRAACARLTAACAHAQAELPRAFEGGTPLADPDNELLADIVATTGQIATVIADARDAFAAMGQVSDEAVTGKPAARPASIKAGNSGSGVFAQVTPSGPSPPR